MTHVALKPWFADACVLTVEQVWADSGQDVQTSSVIGNKLSQDVIALNLHNKSNKMATETHFLSLKNQIITVSKMICFTTFMSLFIFKIKRIISH